MVDEAGEQFEGLGCREYRDERGRREGGRCGCASIRSGRGGRGRRGGGWGWVGWGGEERRARASRTGRGVGENREPRRIAEVRDDVRGVEEGRGDRARRQS